MNVPEFVATLEAAGLSLREQAGELVVNPARIVTPTMKEALATMRTEVLEFLRTRRAGLPVERVSLYQLDRIIEVDVPWSDINIVLAPGCRVARELRAQDPKPGRIWCVCEVLDLLLSGVTPADARAVAEAKLVMDGAVVGVARPPAGTPA